MTKRPRLTDKQRSYLVMVGSHGPAGSSTEFSRKGVREIPKQLRKKGLLQWDWTISRWKLTVDGFAEYQRLLLDEASAAA